MKRRIDPLENANEIFAALKNGVLLTAAYDGRVNPMTVSWGTLGIEWGKPIFTAFVRESRFTKTLLDKNGEFTVNMPVGEFDRNIIGVCGSRSGAELDKTAELGLTLVDGEAVSVPAIKELPLTLECKLVYKQQQTADAVNGEKFEEFYPVGKDGQRDLHTVYCGEIVNAYIIE